jgi:arylsulfatase A-like enzyme
MQSTQAYMERFAGEKDAKRRAHLAMLAALDDAVGAILDTVDRNGLAEETLIVFISDNGGPTWQTTSSNGPLNGVKALVLEGGIRVPAIFRWKGAIPAGRVVSSAAIEFDVTATTLGVAGASDDPNLDGRNLLPFLRGEKAGDVHAQLYWRSGEQGAMRKGPWKLITIDDAHYLFDLRKDVSERKNLVSEQPAKLNELLADWNTWSKSMMAPLWGRNNATENDSARTTELKDLLDRYVKGLPVAPEKLLYGGGPE